MANRPIDDKIIKVTFDNKDSVKNAAETIKQLDTLDSKSLNNIGSNLDKIASKFSTMGAVGFTILQNLINKAIQFSAQLAKTVIVDPVANGFKQYEQVMKSTMMLKTNLGAGASDAIKASIADLTKYANLTVYNVTDMLGSLAQMSNQGIDLGSSTTAIKGLGNVAASAGVDTLQFASTMKTAQVQAMSMGYMNLQNWRQMEGAGMATTKYKDTLVETAKQMGINVDLTKGFDESLSSGWMTTDVMVASLQKLADDPSLLAASQNFHSFSQVVDATKEGVATGWSDVFKALFGDVDASTKLWTGLGTTLINTFTKPTTAITKFVSEFVKIGGMVSVVNGFKNIFKSLSSIIGTITSSIKKMLPANGVQVVANMASGFEKLTSAIMPSKFTLKILSNIFIVLFGVLKYGVIIIGAIAKIFIVLMQAIAPMGSVLVQVAAKLSTFILSFIKMDTIFKLVEQGVSRFTSTIGFLKPVVDTIVSSVQKFVSGLEKSPSAISIVGFAVAGLTTIMSYLNTMIGNGFGFVSSVFKSLSSGAQKASDSFDTLKNSGKESATVLKAGFGGVGTVFTSIKNGIVKVKDIISGVIKKLAEFIDPFVVAPIALKTGMLFIIYKTVKNIAGVLEDLSKLGGSIRGTFNALTEAIQSMQKNIKSKILTRIAISVGILAASLYMLSKIPTASLIPALGGLAAVMVFLGLEMLAISKIEVTKASGNMILIAASTYILAAAFKKMTDLSWGELAKGLTATIGLLGGLTAAVLILSKNEVDIAKIGGNMLLMSAGILVLALSVKMLGSMPTESLLKGVATVAALILAISAFGKIIDTVEMPNITKFVAFSVSIGIIAVTCAALGAIPVANLEQGLLALAAILTELAIFTKVTDGSALDSAAILATAVAIAILAGSIALLGNLKTETIAKGLVTIGLTLATLAIGLNAMSGTTLVGAGSLIVIALSLLVLTAAIAGLGKLKVATIVKGIAGLAIGLVVLVGIGALILPFSAGLVVLGLAIAALGIGMLAIAMSLTIICDAILIFSTISTVTLKLAVENLIRTLEVFAEAAPRILDNITKILVAGIKAFAETILQGLFAILSTITDHTQEITDASLDIVTALINGFAEGTPPLIEAGDNLIITLVEGMAETLYNNNDRMAAAINNFTLAIIDTILLTMGEILGKLPIIGTLIQEGVASARAELMNGWDPEAARVSASNAMTGMTNGIANGGLSAKSAAIGAASGVSTELSKTDGSSGGIKAGLDFANGLTSKAPDASSAGAGINSTANDAMTSIDTSSSGRSVGDAYVEGISSSARSEKNAGKLSSAMAWIKSWFPNSPAKRGAFSGKGWVLHSGYAVATAFADGISKMAPKAGIAASNLMTTTSNIINSLEDKLNTNMTLQPVITPKFDMRNVPKSILTDGSVTLNGVNLKSLNDIKKAGQINNSEVNNKYDINVTTQATDPVAVANEVERIIVRKINK